MSTPGGVALLVKTIGGQWGTTELEERFEYFERALYGAAQKPDETNDTYISTMDNYFAHFKHMSS